MPGQALARMGAIRLGLLCVMLALLLADAATAAALSDPQARGKQIYMTGSSASGRDITAYVGQAMAALPASALPCANCHGDDGLGRPEGGVVPSNVTWSQLTKAYGSVSATGRRRIAYAPDSLARAIGTGIDSAGNRIDASMPRYRMDPADMADLIAYLQRLEHDLDPGLGETTIRVATVVPQGGSTASLGEAIAGVLQAFFADINAQGGIYGRRLELEVTGAAARDEVLDRVTALIEREDTFALVAPVTAGLEAQLDELAERERLPVIGPFTQFPADAGSPERFTFYLLGGLTVQATALVNYAAQQFGRGVALAVVYPQGGQEEVAAQAIRGYVEAHEWPPPLLVDYPPGLMNAAALAARLRAADAGALVFLGPGPELGPLAEEAARLGWMPYLLLPASQAGRASLDLPTAFQDRVFLAYPTLPSDHTPAGEQEFGRFHERHDLPRQHLPTQVAAYAAAKLFVEGLKTAGHDLSRDKLVRALEALERFDTGLTPPLTYSINRRIGARGAHIVAVDLAQRRVLPGSTWVVPD